MSIMQEGILIISLWLLAAVNCAIVGHIFGALAGKLLSKLYSCWVGVDLIYTDEGTTVTYKGREAWQVLSAIEELQYLTKLKNRL